MSDKSKAFAEQVETVVAQFEQSLRGDDWDTKRYEKRMRDEYGAVYSVTSLRLAQGPTRLLVDPNGFDIPGADAAVDVFLMPAYDPVASLYLDAGKWSLHSPDFASAEAAPNPGEWRRVELTGDLIRTVMDSIARHAVPSV